MAESPPALLAFFGHHRCGTQWLTAVLEGVAAATGRGLVVTSDTHTAQSLRALVRARPGAILDCRTSQYAALAELGALRAFHVIRDPRDLVVSAYYSHRYSHPVTSEWPELVSHREALNALPLDEGLLLEMDFSAGTIANIDSWDYTRPDIVELRLEDLASDPYAGLMGVFDFLGVLDDRPVINRAAFGHLLQQIVRRLPIPSRYRGGVFRRDVALGIVWDNRFERLAGRARGDEDEHATFRSGVPGGWRRAFTAQHVAAFKERFPGLLLKLGYEVSPDWDRARAAGAGDR